MRNYILACLCVLTTACATLTPGGDHVTVTRDATSVQGCAALGDVYSTPPYGLPGEDLTQVKNATATLGGNRVLLTSARVVITRGVAYRCEL